MFKSKLWFWTKLMMSSGFRHHPARNMGQSPIYLVHDKHFRALEMLSPNDND